MCFLPPVLKTNFPVYLMISGHLHMDVSSVPGAQKVPLKISSPKRVFHPLYLILLMATSNLHLSWGLKLQALLTSCHHIQSLAKCSLFTPSFSLVAIEGWALWMREREGERDSKCEQDLMGERVCCRLWSHSRFHGKWPLGGGVAWSGISPPQWHKSPTAALWGAKSD